MSLKADLSTGLAEARRLRILTLLLNAPAYSLDEVVLQNQLARAGQAVAVNDLHGDLRHLRDRDCVVVDTGSGVWIVALTRTGGDAVSGVLLVEGVARPAPGA